MFLSEKSTVGSSNFTVNYDLVIRNIDELNTLAGEGIAHVQKTTGGAKLKVSPKKSICWSK